jgi:biotin synthase-related radical SAM superfamily protein
MDRIGYEEFKLMEQVGTHVKITPFAFVEKDVCIVNRPCVNQSARAPEREREGEREGERESSN